MASIMTPVTDLPSIDGNALGRLIGVTPKEVYDLTKAGVLVRVAGRLFDLEASVRRYCAHLRQQQAAAAK